jgi:hypothetical protein
MYNIIQGIITTSKNNLQRALFLLVKKAQIHVHWVLCGDFGAGWEICLVRETGPVGWTG